MQILFGLYSVGGKVDLLPTLTWGNLQLNPVSYEVTYGRSQIG
ncbi:MAG: hypothetical protein AAF215_23075 [Cyanobacteria bacterium P01_A01_bin.123]